MLSLAYIVFMTVSACNDVDDVGCGDGKRAYNRNCLICVWIVNEFSVFVVMAVL